MGDLFFFFLGQHFINSFNTFKFQEIVNFIRILLVIIKLNIKEMGLR